MMTMTTTSGGPQNHQRQFPSSSTSSSMDTRNNVASLGSFLTNNPRLLPPDVDGTTSNSNNNNSQQQYHHRHHHRRRIEEEYDLRDLLGTGTCGEVRRAIHRQTGEERAVKIISIDGRGGGGIGMGGGVGVMPGGMSSEKLAAIQAEADILRSLDHPYVVKLFDAYISPGKAIYLVMELIRGGDLFDRIVERERYTEVQARRLFRRILAAVYYLHEERGIVHRDLKPENILVVDRRSDVNIKLTDFGLAKNMTAQGLKTFCGTPQVMTSLLCWYFDSSFSCEISSCPSLLIHSSHQYFAPEVLRRQHTVKGDGRYGKEIDCWSIGVILFILLSGSPPFDVSAGFDAVASAKVIFHEDQWSHVSREARDLVKRLLEKDPRRRMSVRDACRHSWMLVEDGDTHCHPLHDPLIAKSESTAAIDEVKDNSLSKGENCGSAKSTEIDEKGVAATNSANPDSNSDQTIRPPVNVNGVNNIDSIQMCHEELAPHNDMSNDERQPSLWSSVVNDKTVTKAIQQTCQRASPNGSPIQKRQLFDDPSPVAENIDSTCKRISKRGMESIMAAGNSLPPPVINEDSLLVRKVDAPKKKVQSTLFPPTDTSEEQVKTASLPKKNMHGNTRKAGTSTVTPPGTEQNNNCGLVFRLNKKQKVGGKYISPEMRQTISTAKPVAAAPAVKKAELSEDELQSDFSDKDDEDHVDANSGNPSRNPEKNPLEKYIHKRKMESIDSTASVEIRSNPRIVQRSSKEGLPRPVSKTAEDDVINPAENPKSKEKKFVQTCLFGKSPPNNELIVDAGDGPNIESEPIQSNRTHSGDGTGNLHCQSMAESVGSGAGVTSTSAAPSKGKQRCITSWLVK